MAWEETPHNTTDSATSFYVKVDFAEGEGPESIEDLCYSQGDHPRWGPARPIFRLDDTAIYEFFPMADDAINVDGERLVEEPNLHGLIVEYASRSGTGFLGIALIEDEPSSDLDYASSIQAKNDFLDAIRERGHGAATVDLRRVLDGLPTTSAAYRDEEIWFDAEEEFPEDDHPILFD